VRKALLDLVNAKVWIEYTNSIALVPTVKISDHSICSGLDHYCGQSYLAVASDEATSKRPAAKWEVAIEPASPAATRRQA
jgi:hypothetical protein